MIQRNAGGGGRGWGIGAAVVLMKGAVDRHVTGNLHDGKHAWQIKISRFIKWRGPVSDPSVGSERGLFDVWRLKLGECWTLGFSLSFV